LTQGTETCDCGGGTTTATENTTSDDDSTENTTSDDDSTENTIVVVAPENTTNSSSTGGGQSSGPGRLLTGESNGTSESDAEDDSASTAATEECVCVVVPEVISSFTSTLSVADPAELVNFDLEAMTESMQDSQGWTDAVAVPTFKLNVAFTLPAGTVVTTLQCESIARAAFDVDPTDAVTCSTGDSDSASDSSRRLQAVVLDVQIAYSSSEDAVSGATAVADTSSLVSELAAEGIDIDAADVSASSPTVDVEIAWEVTSTAAITAPAAADFTDAVGDDIAVTVVVSEIAVTYTIQPCSVLLEASTCPSGSQAIANADEVGCGSALCTMEADSDACCATVMTTSSANINSMVGSLMAVVLAIPVFWL